MADQSHEELNQKMAAARQKSLEDETRANAIAKGQEDDATDLTVAT